MRSHSRRSTKQAAVSGDTATALALKVASQQLDKERVLEEAVQAYHEQRREGRQVSLTQISATFPAHRKSVRHALEVEEAIREEHLGEEPWPELYSHFLGFDIIYQLGVGAIARVYLATEPACGNRLVAVKVARGGHDEAETLGRLSHPNVVPVHSVQKDPETGMTAVCMPYLGSATLADLWDRVYSQDERPSRADVVLDVAQGCEQIVGFVDGEQPQHEDIPHRRLTKGTYVDGVVHLGIQMAEALEYTHECDVLHRDLKPSNVLLSPSGRPMLLDFNLATDGELRVSRLGGTLEYMPPEQIRDVHLEPHKADLVGDPRSDLFSLAVILYELLAGRLPFGDPPELLEPRPAAQLYFEGQQTPPVPLRALNPQVDAGLAQTIDRCLALDPKERPQSAGELAGELNAYFDVRRQATRAAWRHRSALAIATAFLLAGLFGLIGHLLTRGELHERQYGWGIKAMQRGDFEEAIDWLERSRETFGAETTALRVGRAYCYMRVDKYPLANAELNATVRNDRSAWDDILFLECLGFVQYTEATGRPWGTYNALSQIEPQNPDRHAAIAYVYLHRSPRRGDRYAQMYSAERAAYRGLELDPDHQLLHHLRSTAFRELAGAAKPEQVHAWLDKACDSVQRALDAGSSYASLEYDAATIFGLAASHCEDYLPEFQKHLRNCTRTHGYKQLRFRDWENESWFQQIRASAPADRIGPTRPSENEVLPIPTVDAVTRWMRLRERWPDPENRQRLAVTSAD